MRFFNLTWCAALLLAASVSAQPLSQYIDGEGFHGSVRAQTPRPDATPYRQAAEASALSKCLGLYGPGSKVTEHSAPHWRDNEPHQGRVDREFYGVYVCTAGTEDREWLLNHFLELMLNPPKVADHDLQTFDTLASWQFYALGEMAVPALLRTLREPHAESVQNTLKVALLNTRSTSREVVDYFLALLTAGDDWSRQNAAADLRLLASYKSVDAAYLIESLQPFLASTDLETRRLAFDALGGLGKRGTALKPVLWKLLNENPGDFTPPNAADALADIGGDASDLPLIAKALATEAVDEHVKADLLWVAEGAGTAALPLLHEALTHSSGVVNRMALHVLPKIGLGKDLALNARILAAVRKLALDPEFAQSAEDALTVFEAPERAAAEHARVRKEEEASRAKVSELELRDSPEAWLLALGSTDSSVRWAAKEHLRAMKSDTVLPAVINLLKWPEANVRGGALEFLRDLGQEGHAAKGAIWNMIRQYPDQVEGRLSLAQTLIAMGVSADDVDGAHQILTLPNLHPQRRSGLLEAMSTLGPLSRPLVSDLEALIQIDLVKLSPEAAGVRNNPVDGDVYQAVIALGKIGPSGNVELDARIAARLKELSEIDDFNVPAWMRNEAKTALAAFRK